ncbi:MAG: C1 family peptidase [Bacteroidales bacterium]|nr:C1 family peptidase [Bacteroidales bacterium]
MIKKIGFFVTFFALCSFLSVAQEEHESYQFDTIINLDVTPVKNQAQSGTCWSFATVSMLESELLRKTGKHYDLSEMFFVRYAYINRADQYLRRHGNSNFGPGGQAHDVIDVLKSFGCMPEKAYNGLPDDKKIHNHGELDAVLQAYLDVIRRKRSGSFNTQWLKGFNALLDAYLGGIPDTFDTEKTTHTPISYVAALGLNADDYIELTSFTHQPFYSNFVLEIPDNWSDGLYFNIPINEMMNAIDHALEHGYTIAWDGDVSNVGFSFFNGVAVVPENDLFDGMNKEEVNERLAYILPEKMVTQDYRQEMFDKQVMTDDHLMHLTGMAKDQYGTKYYLIKNSWGTSRNNYGGYLLMSEQYLRLNTIAVMLNKEGLPKSIGKAIK